MKKYIFLLILLMTFKLFSISNSIYSIIPYSKWNSLENNIVFEFKENMAVDISIKYSDGFILFNGVYEFGDDSILIKYILNEKKSWSKTRDIMPEENTAEFKIFSQDTLSLKYSYNPYKHYLKLIGLLFHKNRTSEFKRHMSEDQQVWNKKIKFDIGTEINIMGITAVFMDERVGVITENLKFRERPSIDALQYSYKTNEGKEIPYLVKGTKVLVLYRTQNKEKVKEWYNYWYYVKLEQVDNNIIFYLLKKEDDFNRYFNNEAWCFGEFIKFE